MLFSVQYIIHTRVVPECGKLFEWYMDVCAPYAQNRKWNKILNDAEAGDGFPIEPIVQQDIKVSNANGFIGWCLYHVSSIGSASRRQMFYHTFVATYFGLSREGIDMLSRYGFAQALRTFDDTRDDIRVVNNTKTRLQLYVSLQQHSSIRCIISMFKYENLFRKFFCSPTSQKFSKKILVAPHHLLKY